MLIYARTCNIFVILTPRSNSGLLRGTAKFWESKNENIAFLSDQLVPIFSFTLKGFISAVSDLLGHFFQCQNQITKTGRLWLSATVERTIDNIVEMLLCLFIGLQIIYKDSL